MRVALTAKVVPSGFTPTPSHPSFVTVADTCTTPVIPSASPFTVKLSWDAPNERFARSIAPGFDAGFVAACVVAGLAPPSSPGFSAALPAGRVSAALPAPAGISLPRGFVGSPVSFTPTGSPASPSLTAHVPRTSSFGRATISCRVPSTHVSRIFVPSANRSPSATTRLADLPASIVPCDRERPSSCAGTVVSAFNAESAGSPRATALRTAARNSALSRRPWLVRAKVTPARSSRAGFSGWRSQSISSSSE